MLHKKILSVFFAFSIIIFSIPLIGINEVYAVQYQDVLSFSRSSLAYGLTIKKCNTTASGVLEIPNEAYGMPIVEISDSAFMYCADLTAITLPDTVQCIGMFSFYQCTSLTNITFPESLEIIKDGAFRECGALTSAVLPESLNQIGTSAFEGCVSLESAAIPERVTVIPDCAFYGCLALTNLSIPYGVSTIGNSAFFGCPINELTIPDSVKNIGDSAFGYIYGEDLAAFINPDLTVKCYDGSAGKNYVINNGITYIIISPKLELSVQSSLRIDSGEYLIVTNNDDLHCSNILSQFLRENVFVYKNSVQLSSDGIVSTGCEIRLVGGETIIDTLAVVFKGDMNGDGVIDAADAMLSDLALNNHLALSGAYFEAANMDEANEAIDIVDFSEILNIAVGKI